MTGALQDGLAVIAVIAVIAVVAVAVLALVGAVLGGLAAMRPHREVDRAGLGG